MKFVKVEYGLIDSEILNENKNDNLNNENYHENTNINVRKNSLKTI